MAAPASASPVEPPPPAFAAAGTAPRRIELNSGFVDPRCCTPPKRAPVGLNATGAPPRGEMGAACCRCNCCCCCCCCNCRWNAIEAFAVGVGVAGGGETYARKDAARGGCVERREAADRRAPARAAARGDVPSKAPSSSPVGLPGRLTTLPGGACCFFACCAARASKPVRAAGAGGDAGAPLLLPRAPPAVLLEPLKKGMSADERGERREEEAARLRAPPVALSSPSSLDCTLPTLCPRSSSRFEPHPAPPAVAPKLSPAAEAREEPAPTLLFLYNRSGFWSFRGTCEGRSGGGTSLPTTLSPSVPFRPASPAMAAPAMAAPAARLRELAAKCCRSGLACNAVDTDDMGELLPPLSGDTRCSPLPHAAANCSSFDKRRFER